MPDIDRGEVHNWVMSHPKGAREAGRWLSNLEPEIEDFLRRWDAFQQEQPASPKEAICRMKDGISPTEPPSEAEHWRDAAEWRGLVTLPVLPLIFGAYRIASELEQDTGDAPGRWHERAVVVQWLATVRDADPAAVGAPASGFDPPPGIEPPRSVLDVARTLFPMPDATRKNTIRRDPLDSRAMVGGFLMGDGLNAGPTPRGMAEPFGVRWRRLVERAIEAVAERRAEGEAPAKATATKKAKPMKKPPDKYIQAYRLRLAMPGTLNDIAEVLARELGKKVTNRDISKWVKRVDKYLKAGNVLPNFHDAKAAPVTYSDPDILDAGERTDGKTSRNPQALKAAEKYHSG